MLSVQVFSIELLENDFKKLKNLDLTDALGDNISRGLRKAI
ncbi:MAG: hypothetical protein RSA71_04935 [Eubacterium sp.]